MFFEFYHSNIRITIECAFGVLIHKWGRLRKPIPYNIRLSKICALVRRRCILCNFCINKRLSNSNLFKRKCNTILRRDASSIALNGGYAADRLDSENSNDNNITYQFNSHFDVVHHSNDLTTVSINQFVIQQNNVSIDNLLPRVEMLEKLEISGLVIYPKPRGSTSTNLKCINSRVDSRYAVSVRYFSFISYVLDCLYN